MSFTPFVLPLFGSAPNQFGTKEQLEQNINALAAELDEQIQRGIAGGPLVGEWDASTGAFPTSRPNGTPIKIGDNWRVSVGGTVDGVQFFEGDYLQSLRNAHFPTFAGNWAKSAIGEMLAEIAMLAEQVDQDMTAAADSASAAATSESNAGDSATAAADSASAAATSESNAGDSATAAADSASAAATSAQAAQDAVDSVGDPLPRSGSQPMLGALDFGNFKGVNLLDGTEPKDAATVGQLASAIPSGIIVMWSGSAAAIPAGWFLCDGTNGTPDWRDKFIVGAGGAYEIGDTGGADTVTLTTAQMPSHNHTGSTNSTGNHTHASLIGTGSVNGAAVGAGSTFSSAAPTGSAGSHSHSLNINNRGGGEAHENRPPYYAAAYIMKG